MTISVTALHYSSLFYIVKGIVCLLSGQQALHRISRGCCAAARDCPVASVFSTDGFHVKETSK